MAMINPPIQENKHGVVSCTRDYFKGVVTTLRSRLVDFAKTTKKIGEDDPRKIIHSMKVGLALTLVSILYYFRPLYDGFGEAGMWAILTVVVVFEFTVGGTLSKSINKGCATTVAGALGIGAEYLATLCGERGEPVVVAILVFVLASTATFTRFHPSVKRKCDYGVTIFILTFALVAVSGFRVSEILQLVHQRLSTILIGGATCMIISIFVCPVWAGQDLHDLVAANIGKLASYLEGFGVEYFNFPGDNNDKYSFLQGYKSVLNSKATEESLANFAWWEPGHGGFRYNHPWKQYLKIGALAAECACHITALDGYLVNSKPKAASEIFRKLQKPCTTMSSESAKALKELASAIKILRFPSSAIETYVRSSRSAADEFKSSLKNIALLPQQDIEDIMQLLVVASVLIDIIKCGEKISESVHELCQKAGFRKQTSWDIHESC